MKPTVALNLPKPAGEVITLARSIVSSLTDHPLFPSPTPSLATVAADADAADDANVFVLTRTRGARTARDAKLLSLTDDLRALKAYVQTVANLHPPYAEAIIESSGMSVKHPSIRTKALLRAVNGPVSGQVILLAKSAGDRAAYTWQFGLDGITWTQAPQTLQARAVLSGLTPTETYRFRMRVLTKDGAADFGQVVSLLVT